MQRFHPTGGKKSSVGEISSVGENMIGISMSTEGPGLGSRSRGAPRVMQNNSFSTGFIWFPGSADAHAANSGNPNGFLDVPQSIVRNSRQNTTDPSGFIKFSW